MPRWYVENCDGGSDLAVDKHVSWITGNVVGDNITWQALPKQPITDLLLWLPR
jgi:hypothetical protein